MDYSKSYYDRTQNVVDRYIIKYSELFKPNNKVLDIGCGTGANSKFLKELGAVVTSFDGSDNAKPYCDRNGVQMTVCDIMKFNYQPNIYDNVICINVLHHLPVYDQKMILPKICNSVKKDGYIFIEIMENYGHSTDKSLSSEDIDSIMSSLGFSKIAIESYKMDNSYKKFVCYIYKRESIPDDNHDIGEGTIVLDEDTYITSDIHIYRTAKNKLSYDDAYTKEVIKTINDTVGVNDTLLFLGDLMFKQDPKLYENTKKFISMIRCKNLYLILGNHDVLPVDDYIECGFKGVYDKIVTKDYVFTHFPVNVENGKINIHGHIHGAREYWNVSADRHIDVFWKMNENKPHQLKYYLNEYRKGKYRGKTVMREQTPFEPRLDNPGTLFMEESFQANNLSVLLEYYQGKQPELIKCEKLLQEIIDDTMKKYKNNNLSSVNISKMKQNKEIEKILSNLLNADITITWISAHQANGITRYNATNLFRKRPKISTLMLDSIIWDKQLTPGELMSVILHECGHVLSNSLFASVLQPLLLLCCEVVIVSLFTSLIANYGTVNAVSIISLVTVTTSAPELWHKSINALQSAMKKCCPAIFDYVIPFFSYVDKDPNIDTFVKSHKLYKKAKEFIKISKQVADERNSIIKNALINNNIIRYREEQIADSLATAYGYGPEGASALIKLGRDYSDYFNFECAISDIYGIIMLSSMDPHPSTHQRVLSDIKILKADLENNQMDDGMKRQIMNDLKELEKIESNYGKLSTTERFIVTTALHDVCNKITGNYDIRASITNIEKSKVRF